MHMYYTLFVYRKYLLCKFVGYFSKRNYTVHNKHLHLT
jgi:hypothetical protein